MLPTSDTPPRLAWDLNDIPRMGGPSRATVYRLEKAGRVKLIRGCGRVKIADAELRRLLQLEGSQ